MSYRRGLLYFSFLVLALLTSAHAENEPKKLIIAADPWCPFNCNPARDGVNGYIVDLLFEMGKKEGWHLEYQLLPWSRALLGLAEGTVDIAIGVDPTDRNQITTELAWGISHLSAISVQKSGFVWQGVHSIKNKRVALVADYVLPGEVGAWVQQHPHLIETVHGETALGQGLAMVDRGRVDVFFNSAEVTRYYVKRYNIQTTYTITPTGNQNQVLLGVRSTRSDARQLKTKLDTELVQLRRSGYLNAILNNYNLKDWQTTGNYRAH